MKRFYEKRLLPYLQGSGPFRIMIHTKIGEISNWALVDYALKGYRNSGNPNKEQELLQVKGV